MSLTYEPIYTNTLTSNVSSVTISNINQNYTDLVLVFRGTKTGAGNATVQFNGDTATNYSSTNMWGNSSSADVTNSYSNVTSSYIDLAAGSGTVQQSWLLYIPNYSNTTTFKTALIRHNNNSDETLLGVMGYRSTSAISSIKLEVGGANWSSGGNITIYGILAERERK